MGSRGAGLQDELLVGQQAPRGSTQEQRERRKSAAEGGWCGGKWNHSCHSSQSFTFNLGRFETKKGVKLCANPEEKWVQKAVQELLEENSSSAP